MFFYILWARQGQDFLAVWGFCFSKTERSVLEWGESGNKIFGKSKRSHLLLAAGGRLGNRGAAFLPRNSCHPHSISHNISGVQHGLLSSGMGMLGCKAMAILQLAEVWCLSQSCQFCFCKQPALAVDVFKPLGGVTEVGNKQCKPLHLFLTTCVNVKYLSGLVLGLSTDISSLFPESRKKDIRSESKSHRFSVTIDI